MTLEQARAKAQEIANATGSTVIVYQSTLKTADYGTAFTLPTFAANLEQVRNTVDVTINGITTLAN